MIVVGREQYECIPCYKAQPDVSNMRFYNVAAIAELDALIDEPPDWPDDLEDWRL